MNKLVFLLFTIVLTSCNQAQETKTIQETQPISENEIQQKPELDLKKTEAKATEALAFAKKKNLNTSYCILVDMSLHSGVKRMVVWDFENKKMHNTFLVGHGCGSANWSDDETKDSPTFSNVDGSHLSSLGKYSLGERGKSDWGIGVKYLMHGLEETNYNALKRFIVFHSWNLMSDDETFPEGSPEGWGCPTISNAAMLEIDPMLKNEKKPLLLWIYQ